jgi:hypothetical protein
MSQGLAFLIWLLCVGISAVLIGYFLKTYSYPTRKEGFAVYTCPSGTNSFVTDSGETQCCNGDVVDGYCTGNLRCTLSPKSKSGLPTCTDLAASDAASAGASKCPPSMPHYFGSCTGIEGCSASTPTANGLQPSNPLQPQCILYKTQAEDLVKLDSCYNVRQANMKAAECSAAQATANLPACVAAASAVSARAPSQSSGAACPVPSFVLTGDWIGSRIAIQKKYIMANNNVVHAIQQGEHVKMVVTDRNNITITARYYSGSINDLNTRASDMSKVNAMVDATGHYILSSAP